MKEFIESVLKNHNMGDKQTITAVFILLKMQMRKQVEEYKNLLDEGKSEEELTEDELAIFSEFETDIDKTVMSAVKMLDFFEKKTIALIEEN